MDSSSARLSNVVRSARSGLVLVERDFSLGKTHKICSLELITEEWWLDFLELEKNFFAWAAYVQGSLLAYFKEGGGVRNKPPPDDGLQHRATRDIERRAPMRVFGATRMP